VEPKAKTIAERFGFRDPELTTPRHDEIMMWLDENIEDVYEKAKRFFPGRRKMVWEKPIVSGTYIVGFADMAVEITRGQTDYFEIKPSIPSLGEIMRQIQMYRQYGYQQDAWMVVSPDDRFRKMLGSQGIGFIKCP
jgi:hypothetical protein